jgi:hypothetical protein
MLNTLQRLTRLGKYITVTAASCAIKYTVELWVPGLDLDSHRLRAKVGTLT